MAAYIFFTDVTGPCKIKDHEGWIVMNNWSWSATREVSGGNQIGLASGVAKFEALTFTAPIGSATMTMFKKMVGGQHFPEVIIHCTKSTGGEDPEVWLTLKLEHVLVTSIEQSVDEDENEDTVAITFSQIEMWIKDQDADGKLGNQIDFIYDLTTASAS